MQDLKKRNAKEKFDDFIQVLLLSGEAHNIYGSKNYETYHFWDDSVSSVQKALDTFYFILRHFEVTDGKLVINLEKLEKYEKEMILKYILESKEEEKKND